MKRNRLFVLTMIAAALVSASGVTAMNHEANSEPTVGDDLALTVLRSHSGLARVLAQADRYRLQLVIGLVENGPHGRLILRQHGFRSGAEYFYPASTVKLFAAAAALERLAHLRRSTGLAIDVDTPLVFHPLFAGQQIERQDPDNVESGQITVRQQIREIFLVSDNDAFNRLYELVGQDLLAESLHRAGIESARIVHRLDVARSLEENRQAPRIDFAGSGFLHTLPERLATALPEPEPVAGISVGSGYLSAGTQINEPMDFANKNRVSLTDLQRGLCMLVRPDVDCSGARFHLDETDRALLLEAMVQYPRESANPVYDPDDYPDDYVKFLLPGLTRVIPLHRLRIHNKVGQAYGFTTENAWVVDQSNGRGFFLAATLFTNEDGILNDDQYEYDEIALPFLADLGEAAARVLWSQYD